jgi:hypothetical protein
MLERKCNIQVGYGQHNLFIGVRNMKEDKNKLVRGVGLNDLHGEATYRDESGKKCTTKAYDTWRSMLQRCYDPKWHEKYPTYIGCYVSEDWKLFSNFKKWFDENYIEGYQLDKDILNIRNREYSENNCVFVSGQLNKVFNDRGSARGDYPQGVVWHKRHERYQAQITINGKKHYLSYETSIAAAHYEYLFHKNLQLSAMIDNKKSGYLDINIQTFNKKFLKSNPYDYTLKQHLKQYPFIAHDDNIFPYKLLVALYEHRDQIREIMSFYTHVLNQDENAFYNFDFSNFNTPANNKYWHEPVEESQQQ